MYSFYTSATVELCGPEDPFRLSPNKEITLLPFLPDFLKETEVEEVLKFFQDFLNSMYYEYNLSTSATPYEQEQRSKISILEKINRLTELHDPELVDMEYIQTFASYLGYNVDLNKSEIGLPLGQSNSDDLCYQEDIKRYTRFIVESLPSWYKIKTTNNAVKIMLYSFGLVGEIVDRWTDNYSNDPNHWINFRESVDDYSDIPSGYYPTPHFMIYIDLDESTSTFLDPNVRNNVFRAINSIKPVNAVFDSFLGHSGRSASLGLHAMVAHKYFQKFELITEDMITEDDLFYMMTEDDFIMRVENIS